MKLIDTLERSVSRNLALLSGWRELERLYRANGDTTKAGVAARHRETLERLPPAVVEAGSLFSTGELAAAQRVLRQFLREQPRHPEALRLLGRIAHHCQQLDEASDLFEVEDFAAQVQRLLRYCGLEPESACLRFHRTARSINTASSEQVRQLIYRSGLTDWRHFEPWLAPLQEALA